MNIKTLILAMLSLVWTAPAFAITAEATYNQLAQVVAVIHNQDATQDDLETAMEQAKNAVREYAKNSTKTARLGYKDPLVPEFKQTSVGLSIISGIAMNGGNIERARRDAQETIDELRARMR